jgi:hypothetical protein
LWTSILSGPPQASESAPGVGAVAVLVREGAAHPDRADDPAAVADQERALARHHRHPHERVGGGEHLRPLRVDLGQLRPVPVPERGADRLRLGDLRRERRCRVHPAERDRQPALVDDRDADVPPVVARVRDRRGDELLGLLEGDGHQE